MIRQDVVESGESYYFQYVYNELNQLMQVKRNNTLIAEYFYDHAGLRYKKKDYVTGKTTLYVYGTGTEPLYEEIFNTTSTLGTPATKTAYLNMGTKRLARSENGSTSYYFTDHLGSTRIVMNAAGVCTYNEYEPFGADFGAANGERYKFTGKEDDGATGLQYFNAWYYDPAVGRFVSEDPVKDGWNWYQYCENGPMNYLDPRGEQPVKAQAGTISQFAAVMNNSPSKIGMTTGNDASKALLYLGSRKGFKPIATPYFNMSSSRYIYTKNEGWIDMVHFLFYAGRAYYHMQGRAKNPVGAALREGYQQEFLDKFRSPWSAYSYEDLPSDLYGAIFATQYFDPNSTLTLAQQIEAYLNTLGATDPTDAVNWDELPEKDSKNKPKKTNKTTTLMYIY